MKRSTNFGHVSTRTARKVAIEDMKKANVNANLLYLQHRILNQPVLTQRCGLFGF